MNYSGYIIVGNFDRATNPHPTDSARETWLRHIPNCCIMTNILIS